MSDQKNNGDEKNENAGKDSISIIYHQKNDSPKYFEVKRSKVYLFFIGLPAITLIALVIGAVGIVNTSPFHLLENYRQTIKARKQISSQENLEEKFQETTEENNQLKAELLALKSAAPTATATTTPEVIDPKAPKAPAGTCPAPIVCPTTVSSTVNSIGLSTLSFFKPIQGQKDRTRPAILNLSGFKVVNLRDTVNLQFNIIPAGTDDAKISGNIIVLMKNELAIQVYPLQALSGNDFQINYATGETFATQRFRPVDASFIKPKKSGNYSFTVFIFSRTGDLIHFQTIVQPVKL